MSGRRLQAGPPAVLRAALWSLAVGAAAGLAACATAGDADPGESGPAAAGPVSTAPEPPRQPLGDPPDPGPAPSDHGLDDDLLAAVTASTVHVGGIACGRATKGSGFAVAPDLIATAAHTIVGLGEATVSGTGGLSAQAVPVAFDARSDLALLRVDAPAFVPLPIDSAAADQTVGALMGWEDAETPDPTPFRIDRPLTVRIDAVASGEQVERSSWLLAADVELGDSGAALVNGAGAVVGIAYASTRRDSEVGYATRASELEALIALEPEPSLAIPDC